MRQQKKVSDMYETVNDGLAYLMGDYFLQFKKILFLNAIVFGEV